VTILGATLVAATAGGCAKRTIDPEATGSVAVPGTEGTLQRFCDGGVAIYWTPNVTAGESDDYEFLVYDHPDCTGDSSTGPRVEDIPEEGN
jgi:hypothetical protein